MATESSFTSRSLDPDDLHGAALGSPSRLAAIDRSRLLQRDRDEILDRATRLASKLLGTSMALVSIVTDRAQHFVGATGPGGRFDDLRQTPLSHSFCQYVVRGDAAFVVDDATTHPLVQDNLAIPELGVIAYLGVPLRDADGQVLGSFCALDSEQRIWTEADRQAMVDLADFVRAELLLRDHLDRTEQAQHARDDLVKTVAHDLRAAVMAVVGALQTLDAHPDADPDHRQQVTEVALRQSRRIQDMMERLLDTPTAAGLPLADTDLREVTDAAVAAACAALDGDERVEIDVEPIAVSTHAPSLERALVNLVRNALQHTDGPIRVAGERDRDQVIITVSDHGPGLPEWLLRDDLGDASLRGRSTGHGIGLFSAVTLVRSLGGDITVQTGAAGTTLLLTLPATGPQAD